jgi:hypothetical protein
MTDTTGCPTMAKKKKSEVRVHTGILRTSLEAIVKAKKAASLMEKTLAEYASEVLIRAADKDLEREAKKFTKGGKE